MMWGRTVNAEKPFLEDARRDVKQNSNAPRLSEGARPRGAGPHPLKTFRRAVAPQSAGAARLRGHLHGRQERGDLSLPPEPLFGRTAARRHDEGGREPFFPYARRPPAIPVRRQRGGGVRRQEERGRQRVRRRSDDGRAAVLKPTALDGGRALLRLAGRWREVPAGGQLRGRERHSPP